jgi:hypothetical protein
MSKGVSVALVLVVTGAIALGFFGINRRGHIEQVSNARDLGGGSRIIAFDANQRLLIAGHSPWLAGLLEHSQSPQGKAGSNVAATTSSPYQTICAEPSPDALTDTSSEASLKLRAKLLDTLSKYGSNGQNIGVRTPTVQVLRDAMYRLCEAFNAGGLSPTTYAILMQQYQGIMVGLLAIEDLTGNIAAHTSKDQGSVAKPIVRSGTEDAGGPEPPPPATPTDNPLSDRAQIGDAVVKIVDLTVNRDRRTDLCVAVLSFPDHPLDVKQLGNGKAEITPNPTQQVLRDYCLTFLFGEQQLDVNQQANGTGTEPSP